jgi:hypothetical protein
VFPAVFFGPKARLPERTLRLLLGSLATPLAVLYLAQSIR